MTPPLGHATLIIHNARVITLDRSSTIASAVAAAGDRIAFIGNDADALALRDRDTVVVDARGRAVIPGLVDGHAHMDREGLKEELVDLADVRSIGDLVSKIAEAARRRPGEWIVTMPLGGPPYEGDPAKRLADGRLPTRADLDEAAPDNPVYIRAPWGYWRPEADDTPLVSIANSAALKLSGITRNTVAPWDGIEIQKDGQGEPTGVFFEPGPVLATELSLIAPEARFSRTQRVRGLARSMEVYNSFGTTAIFEGHGASPEIIEAYCTLAGTGTLTARASLIVGPVWGAEPPSDIGGALRSWYSWAVERGLGNDRLRIGGLYASPGRTPLHDLLSRSMPYTGWAGYSYDSVMSREFLREFLIEAARMRFRVATLHPRSLDLFEEANAVAPIGDLRWVVGHIGTLDDEQIGRMRDLGVVATLHANRSIGDIGSRTARELGPSRVNEIVPTRRMIEQKVPFALSSDNHPVSLFRPIWLCVARKDPRTGEAIAPDQALTREEALRAACQGGSWLTFDEDSRGSLEPGMLADFVVLSDDPLRCDEDNIRNIRALSTIVGGAVVFER